MKYINMLDHKYLVVKGAENINNEELLSLATDYFKDFDYIVGDYAYSKLRLKGFNSKTNSNFKEYNDIDKVDDYLKNYCAYGCKYFILAKEK